jgi:hypothetical protein
VFKIGFTTITLEFTATTHALYWDRAFFKVKNCFQNALGFPITGVVTCDRRMVLRYFFEIQISEIRC